jgi:mono/diheme cytochrome c family protein
MRPILTILILTAFSTGAGFAADAKGGQVAFSTSCKSCHGVDGTANLAMAKALKPEMKDLKSPDVQSRSDADLKKVITDSRGKMHAIASAIPAAADNIVAYLRTLKK